MNDIRFGNTNVGREANLYRFQIDEYPQYDILRVYENKGRAGIEKRTQTIYDDRGFAWVADRKTGEILRRKKPFYIKRSVDESILRTRKVLREICMANHWDWFGTLTFNNREQDRMNDCEVKKQFEKFRKDIRKHFPNMYYVAVMERHKKGGIHFHLLVGGISEEQLQLVDSGHKDGSGRKVYNCMSWRYGYTDFTRIDDSEKASGYILKYIGKDMGVSEEFKKRYWASRNCNRPKKRFVDIVSDNVLNVFKFFDKVVDRTVSMTVQLWKKSRNYLAVRDYLPSQRKIRFYFDNFNDSAKDNFWKSPQRRKVLTM